MDSVSSHESEKIKDPIESAGCPPDCPPPHSPVLNPTGHEWAQAKACGRKFGCSADALFQQHDPQSVYCATAIRKGMPPVMVIPICCNHFIDKSAEMR